VKITVYKENDAFDILRQEWNPLLRRSAADRIFNTWEWQSIWWQAYHPGQLLIITCRTETEQLVGLASWFIHHTEYGRVVRGVGCVDVTDYLDIIADHEYQDAVMHALAGFLSENHTYFDQINLCNLPEDSPTLRLFPEALRQCGFEVSIAQQEVCPIIALPSDWESYLEQLDKKQRHELRRKLRRAEGSGHDIRWYIVGSEHNFEEETARFLALMASSQQQKSEFLQDQQNITFFEKILPAIYNQGWLQLNFLVIDGQAAAAYLNFIYNQHVLVYNSGLLPEIYGHLSPGIILLCYNIQHAIATNCKVFDFLRGNEPYKYRMGGHDTRVFMLKAHLPI
jgi:CelD/BcsL family acetyltransferase involved in cellulose biosynthesis